MQVKEFIDRLDEGKIVAAIDAAEKTTSGEIRVYISHRDRQDALAFARRRFLELGMTKTRERNAVLLYLVPQTRLFAVIGDVAVHQKCGDKFWQEVIALMTERLKREAFTDAIVHAVEKIGALLAEHFPHKPGDTNQLSNRIIED